MIWTVCCCDEFDEAHILRTIDQAAAEGVSGVEVCGGTVEKWIGYRAFPRLHSARAPRWREHQASLARVGERTKARGLRLGLWHHEVEGPPNLLDLMPDLRAKDGLLDLDAPLLEEFIREKCAEFLDLFPAVDEIVLTLTETRFPVAHRPFSEMPIAERIRRVLQAVADATEPRGRTLVIRPFSAVRADELFVRDAVGRLQASRVAMMYKTEPFDWNPFLPDEDLIGSVPRYEIRAETDAGAEYYGQADFPCSYTRFLARRLAPALAKGATVAAIRVDRGSTHNALGHPINEVNVIAPTRLLLGREETLDAVWRAWLIERHGAAPEGLMDLLETSFEVIKKTFYADQQSLTHRAFPTMEMAKTVLAFALFEEDIPLSHLPEHWSMITSRRTPTHAALLAEKEEALALAEKIRADFARLGGTLRPASREAIGEALDRLPLLAEAFLRFCRLTIAHAREMAGAASGGLKVAAFDEESTAFLTLADRVAARFGEGFFREMPAAMRSLAAGLARERALEIPLRAALRARREVVDAVLCGFATEMHRVAKRLHTGGTGFFADRMYRASGAGPDAGFGYTLRGRKGAAARLLLRVAGPSGPAALEAGGARFDLPAEENARLSERAFDLPRQATEEIPIRIWSVTPRPVRLAGIELLDPKEDCV